MGGTPATARPASTLRARRRSLLLALSSALVVVVAVVGVSVAIDGRTSNQSPGTALPDAAAVVAVFHGLPQHGLDLGSPSAPTTLVEYLDLQCPWCGVFARDTFPTIVRRFVRPGRVRVEIRPLDFLGTDSARGREALFAAARRNRAFQFAALLYAHQGPENSGWLSAELIRAAAASVPGLNGVEVAAAGPSIEAARRIERHRAADGVTGVPTFFVKRRSDSGRGTMLVNPSETELATAISRS